jgi:hypothetical protein
VCYSIYVSTDSDQDLTGGNGELIHFRKEAIAEPFSTLLRHENQWFVGSKSVCSCTFRHLFSTELGFSEPVDWFEEDEDEIEATLLFIKIVRRLIDQGHQVDCIDAWYGAAKGDITEMKVNLKDLDDEQFRFFENQHFIFNNGD